MARDGLSAFPLRFALENSKNGSAAMVAHAGCRVCHNRARRWQSGSRRAPDAPRAFRCPTGGGRWPSGIIYSHWGPQKMQLRAHGMLMGHPRDLGFSLLCNDAVTPTCMNIIHVTHTARTHTNTMHTTSMAPSAQTSSSWRSQYISDQVTCTMS